MNVKIPSQLTERAAVQLVADLLDSQDSSEDLALDFSELSWVYPFAALLLAEGIREVSAQRRLLGLRTRWFRRGITIGAVSAAVSYLGHIGFFQHIGVDYGNEPGVARGGRTYLPLTVIARGEGAFHAELEREAWRLANLVFSDEQQVMMSYCLQEIIRNAFEHAAVEECTIFAQKWQGDAVQIAVVDRGRGIQASLAERYGGLTAVDAVTQAIEPGISRITPDPRSDDRWENSGYGLYVVSELGRRFGSFSLISSGAVLRLTGGGRSVSSCEFPGTGVRLHVSTQSAEFFPNILDTIVNEGERVSGTRASRSSRGR